MLVDLDCYPGNGRGAHRGNPVRGFPIRSSAPFVFNSRAVLVHRIRFASIIYWHGTASHFAVRLWCGGGFSGKHLEFDHEPREGRLLCARCEAIAVAAGLPTADELAGRHCCTGTLKAHRECCLGESN